MKTIKNTLLAFVAIAMVMPVLDSCKKGEGDPAISFKSRKSRVAGEWTITSMKSTQSNTSGTPAVTTTNTESFDGTNIIQTSTSGGTTNTTPVAPDTYTRTATITFEKDGTFKMDQVDTYTSVGSVTGTDVTTDSYSGTWTFEGGTGETKKKEYIALYMTSMTSTNVQTYGGTSTTSTNTQTAAPVGGNPMVFQITTCKSKEMAFHSEDAGTWNSASGTWTSSGSSSSSEDWTLEAK